MIKKIVTGLMMAALMSASALACSGADCDTSKCADPSKCSWDKASMNAGEHPAVIAKADEHAGGAVTVTNDKYKLIYKIESDGVDYFLYEKGSNKAIDPKGITGKLTLDNGQSYNIGAMAMGDEPKPHLMMMDKINAKKLTGKVIFKLPDGSRIMFELK